MKIGVFRYSPHFFYILWGLIKAVAFYIKPFVSKKMESSLSKKIIYAGYDYVFKPSEIIASQIVFSFIFTLLALVFIVCIRHRSDL
jgi:tight adherence protein C